MDKKLAYEINGSVYFRVSKHGKYGTLACLDTSGMEASLLNRFSCVSASCIGGMSDQATRGKAAAIPLP